MSDQFKLQTTAIFGVIRRRGLAASNASRPDNPALLTHRLSRPVWPCLVLGLLTILSF